MSIFVTRPLSDWNNDYHQTYGCPRDGGLSASWGLIEDPPETPNTSHHYRIEVFKEGPQLFPHYAERCQFLGQLMLIFLTWVHVVRKIIFKKIIVYSLAITAFLCQASAVKYDKLT